MNKLAPLFGFGIGLLGFGLFWKLFDDVLVAYILPYAIRDRFFLYSDLVWHSLPFIVMLGGVVLLIASGVISARSSGVVQE